MLRIPEPFDLRNQLANAAQMFMMASSPEEKVRAAFVFGNRLLDAIDESKGWVNGAREDRELLCWADSIVTQMVASLKELLDEMDHGS